jgi:hypothetical protein
VRSRILRGMYWDTTMTTLEQLGLLFTVLTSDGPRSSPSGRWRFLIFDRFVLCSQRGNFQLLYVDLTVLSNRKG